MARRGVMPRRSPTEWGIRASLAIATAALGLVTVGYGYAYTLRGSDPARAHAIAPGDGRITGLLAEQRSGPDATAADRATANRLARDALRHDPTAVAAVSTLGLNTQIDGDTTAARRLFAFSQRLSRRDLRTQLWAVEDAVGRGDVAAALRHYDIALRTRRNAPDLLFPILAGAIAEPSVRTALARTLASGPLWTGSFIQYVAGNGPEPRATADLLRTLRRFNVPISREADALVINGLVSRNLVEQAWSYYASIHPGADRRMSRDPDFTADPANPSPFDWTPVNDGGPMTSIQKLDRKGVVDFSAPSTIGGLLLQQIQVLPPGSYRLEGHSIGIEQPDDSLPYWVLTCGNGEELGRVVVPNSAQNGGTFSGRMTVPTGCSVQNLALWARPSEAVGGLSGQLDRARLVPLQ